MALPRMRWFPALLVVLLLLGACGGTPTVSPPTPTAAPASPTAVAAAPAPQPLTPGVGTLELRANGEDSVREGFVTKDGWAISFDHVYVTLANVTAHQTNPPFDALSDSPLEAQVSVGLAGGHTVDLAAGDEDAEPILIGTTSASAGRYNALSWDMVKATTGPAQGAAVLLVGTASKEGTELPFTIRLEQESSETCGDFIGDERKGILEDGGIAQLEATFHFDHLFGDGEAAPDDEINTGALGFEPFARLASDGTVAADLAAIQAGFSAEELALLEEMHLSHVGEGHCRTDTRTAGS